MHATFPRSLFLFIMSISTTATNPLLSEPFEIVKFSDDVSLDRTSSVGLDLVADVPAVFASCDKSAGIPQDSENSPYQVRTKLLKTRNQFNPFGNLGAATKKQPKQNRVCPIRPARGSPRAPKTSIPRGDDDDPIPASEQWDGKCHNQIYPIPLCCVGLGVLTNARVDRRGCIPFNRWHPSCPNPNLEFKWTYCCKDFDAMKGQGIDCILINTQ